MEPVCSSEALAPNMAAGKDCHGIAHRDVCIETVLSGPGGSCMGSLSLFLETRYKSVRGH